MVMRLVHHQVIKMLAHQLFSIHMRFPIELNFILLAVFSSAILSGKQELNGTKIRATQTANPFPTEQCADSILVGRLLANKYQVQNLIQKGTFGKVFSASTGDGKLFAVKCIRKAFDPKEASIMQSLDHPNIIKLVDKFYDEQLHQQFIVTELCEMDLNSALNSESLKYDTQKIFLKILDAVIYMHEKGVYHQDLKLENILLTSEKDQVVKITDFGSATRSALFDGQVVTTALYAAPEIYYHKVGEKKPKYNAANDAWSLGVILFALQVRNYPWRLPPTEYTVVDSILRKYRFSQSLINFFKMVFTNSDNRATVQEMKAAFSKLPRHDLYQ